MISVMLTGCMCAKSNERMDEIHGKVTLPQLKLEKRVMDVYRLMIEIHNYTGETTQDSDISEVRYEFEEFSKRKSFPVGCTIREYRASFEAILRKMRAFKLIGNANENKDKYSKKEVMDNFLSRLKFHPNEHIRALTLQVNIGERESIPRI
jgi:hypothetical protein